MNIDSKTNLRDKLKETTREAILEAAVAVIISGSGEIRMEDIAEKAGVAIGTLYNYFDNRQMLIDTIIERRRNTADSYIRKSLEQTKDQHISTRLENLFQTLFNFLERHRTVTHHSLQLKETNTTNSGRRSLMDMLNDYVREMLQSALERKEIRPEYMEIYPMVISGYLRGFLTNTDDGKETGFSPGLSRKLAEMFLAGAGNSEQKQPEKQAALSK
jgi:AcrR family transcriptional regulator